MEKIKLKLTYFKPSGKYYTEETLEAPKNMPWHQCLELVEFHFVGGCLPGLVTGEKDYIVHVTSDDHPTACPALVNKSLRHVGSLTHNFDLYS
ncbi:hypothetical protein AB204_10595 [Xenorhabdus khoisanae]|uniref:Uncharacterized protein n=1 Tax=Xenorhabdus khoisanae TaxID=880157 RepID=A0A0J5FT87_9GAMM|nr:hypothetical protein [Xenorhabdus khoisanae]KMJ45137.1 hypothetical protein AB204_10595 [Xenorhabdus khoisanae]